MMAALGVGLLPSAFRTLGRRASWTRSHVPSCLHSRKYHHTVPQGGRSCGMARHVQPLRRTYTMPLTTSRRSTVRGLPRSWLMGVGKPEHPTVRRSGRWGMVCVSYLHSNTCPRLLTHPLRASATMAAAPVLSIFGAPKVVVRWAWTIAATVLGSMPSSSPRLARWALLAIPGPIPQCLVLTSKGFGGFLVLVYSGGDFGLVQLGGFDHGRPWFALPTCQCQLPSFHNFVGVPGQPLPLCALTALRPHLAIGCDDAHERLVVNVPRVPGEVSEIEAL